MPIHSLGDSRFQMQFNLLAMPDYALRHVIHFYHQLHQLN